MTEAKDKITEAQAMAFLKELDALTEKHGVVIGGETSALFLASVKNTLDSQYVARGHTQGGTEYEFYWNLKSAKE